MLRSRNGYTVVSAIQITPVRTKMDRKCLKEPNISWKSEMQSVNIFVHVCKNCQLVQGLRLETSSKAELKKRKVIINSEQIEITFYKCGFKCFS